MALFGAKEILVVVVKTCVCLCILLSSVWENSKQLSRRVKGAKRLSFSNKASCSSQQMQQRID